MTVDAWIWIISLTSIVLSLIVLAIVWWRSHA